MTREVQRVLKPKGYYFVISYGRPENRTMHFNRSHLDFIVEVGQICAEGLKTDKEKFDKSHYIYTCQKGYDAKQKDKNWKSVEEALVST